MAIIEVRHLTKTYGSRKAVDDLSFHADEGEVVGLLGPNGAGKTTTMRILACYMDPTGGEARIGGVEVSRDPVEARRLVGYLPESVPLYPEMRVRDYLLFFARLRRMPYGMRRTRLDEAISACGLDGERGTVIGRLSRGYRQRVGLAAALIHDPRVLILDEPTLGMDPNQVREVRQLIRRLRDGRTILFSTHVLSEAEAVCDRLLIMREGRLVAEDSTAGLRASGVGSTSVRAEIRASGREIETACLGLPGVIRCECDPSGEWQRVRLVCEAGADVRSHVYRLAAAREWELRELTSERPALEDVFAALTRRREEPA